MQSSRREPSALHTQDRRHGLLQLLHDIPLHAYDDPAHQRVSIMPVVYILSRWLRSEP